LSDGITEDLCTALSQIRGLHVPARTSSFVFKGKTEDIRKIGGQLNVGTVLEGSVSKAGNKLRISAQLVNVTDGFHLWAANYDREMTDILDIRSDISRRVVEALKVRLDVEETQRLVKKPTETTEAYDSYLLGRYELNKFTEGGFSKAVEHFKRAIAQDPSFALANAGLAEAYNMLGYWNYLRQDEPAVAELNKAIAMDPANSLTHHFLAYVLLKMNRTAVAVAAVEKANIFEGVFTPQQNAELRKTFETAGPAAFFRKEAEVEQQWIERGKYRSALLIALHYIAAGDNDKTLTWLERAVEEHAGWLPEMKMEPTWDAIRSNPRFVPLLKKVGLEK
jgi:adenylate cyclase